MKRSLYPNLEAELNRYGYSLYDVASSIGVTLSTASEKLNKPRRLKLCESVKIRDDLFPYLTVDYLFAETPISQASPAS